MFKKLKFLCLLITSAILLTACNDFSNIPKATEPETMPPETLSGDYKDCKSYGELSVHFIDVGQGDSTLLISSGHAMLIDCGDSDQGTKIQNYLTKQGVESLDYLVLTHPDADHIGGAPVIITKFEIGQVFMSDYEKETKTYERTIDALKYRRLDWETPAPQDSVRLGDAEVTFLAPVKHYDDPNNASIALIVKIGNNSFLFSGDAEAEAETDILNLKTGIQADVYQTGHHGSRTSSSQEFIDAINPAYAVISCGENNDYGHPHAETLNQFREKDINVFRTDEQGTITAYSDGENITWNCAPSDTWKSGDPQGGASVGMEINSEIEESHTKSASFVCNENSLKFHKPDCESVQKMSSSNKVETTASREELLQSGYSPCHVCNP